VCFSTGEKSKSSYTLSEMSYFYDLEIHGIFDVQDQILWDTGIKLVSTHKTRTNGIPMLYAEESNCILNLRKRVFKIVYQHLTVAQLSPQTNYF
jgi:hypothetical protein